MTKKLTGDPVTDVIGIMESSSPTSRNSDDNWAEGPEGDKQVAAYVHETPALFALILELHLVGALEAQETDTPDWETIFTIANHWRENELSHRSEKRLTPTECHAPMAALTISNERNWWRCHCGASSDDPTCKERP